MLDNQNSIKKVRYPLVDYIRTLAVLLMVFFHFFYDLTAFQFTNIDFQKDLFWFYLPRLIVTLFMFSVGISLALVHSKKINWTQFWKRWIKIVIGALVISVSTYFMFPKQWIYFGTLHCIALTSLMGLPFLKYPKTSLITGLVLLALDLTGNNIPWFKMDHISMDYIEPFPWLGCVLFGIFAHSIDLHKKMPEKFTLRPVKFVGQNAFWIYVVHQPILYSFVYLFYWIKN